MAKRVVLKCKAIQAKISLLLCNLFVETNKSLCNNVANRMVLELTDKNHVFTINSSTFKLKKFNSLKRPTQRFSFDQNNLSSLKKFQIEICSLSLVQRDLYIRGNKHLIKTNLRVLIGQRKTILIGQLGTIMILNGF